ncbi:DUF839 domain-containing protein [Sesbania bispinosa]|nr:DUF839 domain-containing protein [Sesbania bispinosa]
MGETMEFTTVYATEEITASDAACAQRFQRWLARTARRRRLQVERRNCNGKATWDTWRPRDGRGGSDGGRLGRGWEVWWLLGEGLLGQRLETVVV